MFSRRPPVTVRRGRPVSRLSPRRDRRAAWLALPPLRRRSPGPRPPGRTPPVPPAGVESPAPVSCIPSAHELAPSGKQPNGAGTPVDLLLALADRRFLANDIKALNRHSAT